MNGGFTVLNVDEMSEIDDVIIEKNTKISWENEKRDFSISSFYLFCASSVYIFLINYCFSFFLSSGVFILSLTLILFFVPTLSQSVGISFCDTFSFSFSLYYCQSLYDITWFYMMYCIISYCQIQYQIIQ